MQPWSVPEGLARRCDDKAGGRGGLRARKAEQRRQRAEARDQRGRSARPFALPTYGCATGRGASMMAGGGKRSMTGSEP
jgi:hypothetical protein